jgi:hypothetical protein
LPTVHGLAGRAVRKFDDPEGIIFDLSGKGWLGAA